MPTVCLHKFIKNFNELSVFTNVRNMTINKLYSVYIVRFLLATLHVGMTGKQDGGYTQ